MATYASEEAAGLQPVELYQFTFGTQTWNFTDADSGTYTHPITNAVYTSEPILRGTFKQSNEDSAMSVDVTIDAACPIADFFRTPYLPAQQVWLLIERTHVGSTIAPAVLFRGKIGQCVFENMKAVLTCVPTRQALSRKIPVQLVQRTCTNTLYDQRCKANPANYSMSATITAINGLTLSISNAARTDTTNSYRIGNSGYFDGGYISPATGTASGPATVVDDIISTTTTGTLKLLYNPGYNVGDTITVYAGCDKLYATCWYKFNNVPNFQGFVRLPQLDPFRNEVA